MRKSGLSGIFSPLLFEQRMAFCLSVLRKYQAKTVLDIGSGEGLLPSLLLNPSSRYDEPSPLPEPNSLELHVSRVSCLDIDEGEIRKLCSSLEGLVHAEKGRLKSIVALSRWEEMWVDVFQGGLESVDERLEGHDAIVALEVIEHLKPGAFEKFTAVLLGHYQPRLLIISTPNYNFNRLFPDGESGGGYPDPTRRTDRVFRHDDHQFEWTEPEFTEYCRIQAETYGYILKTGGIGQFTNQAEFPEVADVFASQGAVFIRKDESVKVGQECAPGQEIKLVKRYEFPAHPMRGKPAPDSEIIDCLKNSLSVNGRERLSSIWYSVDVVLGGSLCKLMQLVDNSDEFSISQNGSLDSWQVIWETWTDCSSKDDESRNHHLQDQSEDTGFSAIMPPERSGSPIPGWDDDETLARESASVNTRKNNDGIDPAVILEGMDIEDDDQPPLYGWYKGCYGYHGPAYEEEPKRYTADSYDQLETRDNYHSDAFSHTKQNTVETSGWE